MRDSYRLGQLKENMIKHLLHSFFIINFFTSLLAADEVNMETSRSLESYIQPPLPQLNLNYEALVPDTNRSENFESKLKLEKDGATYCPHIEILTIILNELRNLIPQSSEKIKDVLSKYYTILEKSLNSRYSVESLNKLSSKNRLNYMDFLAEKLMKIDDKDAKIKITFEYELPTIQKTTCEKLCNDLINFANAENLPTANDLNYAKKQGKMKNNIMTFLQNYRPGRINSNSSSDILKVKKYFPIINKPEYFYPSNSDILPPNPVSSDMPISDPLQSQSQQLPNQTKIAILPLHSPTSNSKLFFLQNFATLPPSLTGIANTPTHSKQPLSPQLLDSKLQNSIPVLQADTEFTNSYPLQSLAQLVGITALPIIGPPSQISNSAAANPYVLLNIADKLPNLKGNINPLQNAAHVKQNPVGLEDSYPVQNLFLQLQGLTENSKDIKNFAKKINMNQNSHKNSQYHYETQKLIHNNKGKNAVQYISKNNETVVTPTKPENRWSQPPYIFTNNRYSNNEKLLQKKPIQSYNEHGAPMPNFVLEANKHAPANLYNYLNKNALSSIKQYESGTLQKDSSSAQASSLNHYMQNLQPVKNLIYPQTNPGTGYLLNQQVPFSFQNIYPFPYGKNNKLYNSYVKKMNQLATHSNIPNGLVLYPNSYYYYKPKLSITNSAKDTQENHGVQFQDLNRLIAVSNFDKLNSATIKNGIVELTFKFNNSKPSGEPFFYVQCRLPYDVFMFNLNKILLEKPNLRNDLPQLFKHLLINSNITSSSVVKTLNKEDLLRLLYTNDTPVTARVLDANDTTATAHIKIVQRLNANMPLNNIVKTDANVSELKENIPSIKYLRERPNYVNDLQRTLAVKNYFLNPYNTQANKYYNKNFQPLIYSYFNRKPPQKYNYLQQQQLHNPYYSHGLNSFSRYN